MLKIEDILFLAFLIVLLTSIFIRIPVGITCNAIRLPLNALTGEYTIETCTINELLFVKLLLTFVIFKYTELELWQFTLYFYAQEIALLFLRKKGSMILHPLICIYVYKWLLNNYDEYVDFIGNISL